ncbi:MAG: hypothetical protein L7S61_06705 [Acidimicrobiales bacterium]|jgi:hypothetical protein|nr:hypothetical protein [Acidimicrobiales bacterium]
MKQNYLHEMLELADDQKDKLATAFEKVISLNGWVNVEPVVEDDSRVETPGLFSWFSARGPQVPVGTLVFEGEDRLVSLGVSHGTGRNASDILEHEGIHAPASWQLKQDHPKRGFVWEVRKEELVTNSAADFLMEATYKLCPTPQERLWTAAVNLLDQTH